MRTARISWRLAPSVSKRTFTTREGVSGASKAVSSSAPAIGASSVTRETRRGPRSGEA